MRGYIIKVTLQEDAFGKSIQDKDRLGCSWSGGDQGGRCNNNPEVRSERHSDSDSKWLKCRGKVGYNRQGKGKIRMTLGMQQIILQGRI